MNRQRYQLMVLTLAILFFAMGCSRVSSEMKDVINNFDTPDNRTAVLDKYDNVGVVPEELTRCFFSKPIVAGSEKKGGIRYYTLESRVEACECSPTAVGTVRVFSIGWKDGKIAEFDWIGPKSGKVEY